MTVELYAVKKNVKVRPAQDMSAMLKARFDGCVSPTKLRKNKINILIIQDITLLLPMILMEKKIRKKKLGNANHGMKLQSRDGKMWS